MAELTAHFVADFSSFKAACDAATVKLKSFQQDAGKVTTSLERMAQSLSGNKIISQAELMAQAVEKLGGVSKLTDAELQRISTTVTEASEKMRRMGMTVPPEMQKILTATREVKTWWGQLGDQVKATALGFISAQAVIGAVQTGIRTLTQFLESSVKAASDAEAAQRKLTQAMEQAGTKTPANVKAMNDLSVAFQKTTVYEDDLITEMEALLVQIGGVMPSQMEKALKASTDLASGLGVDLRTATLLVGKAFAGETGTLKRYGIVVDEAKLKTEGAAAVLEAIQQKFGGQAQAETETYAGKVKQVANAWDDLKEVVGLKILQDPKVEMGLRAITLALSDQDDQLKDTTVSFNDFLTATLKYVGIGGAMELALGEVNDALRAAHKVNTDAAKSHDQWVESMTRGRELAPITTGLDLFNKEIEEQEKKQKAAAAAAEAHAKAMKQFRDSVDPVRVSVYALAPSLSNVTEELHDFIGTLDAGALEFRDLAGYTEEVNDELIGLAPAIKGTVPAFEEGEKAAKSFGAVLKNELGNISQTFVSAFTGGGGVGGGMKAIATQIGSSLAMLIPGIGPALSAAVGPIVNWFGGLFGKSKNLKLDEQATKDLKAYGQEWINTAGGIEQARQRAAAFGYDLDGILGNKSRKGFENVKTDLGAIDEKWAKLQAAMDKYGISVEELGPKFKQIAQNDWAEQLSSDFAILMEAGAASDAVLLKMKDDVNAFVARSIRMGTEIPDSMVPMLEQMAKMGILTDESGNLITDLESSGLKFSKTMTEAFKGVEDAILALPEAIAKALGVIPKEVHIPVDVEITRRYKGDQEPDVPSFASGTGGQYVNFGSGSLAMLHGYEKIVPRNGGGGDGVGLSIVINAQGAYLGTPATQFALAHTVSDAVLRDLKLRARLATT